MLLVGRLMTSHVDQTRGLPLSSNPARHALLEVGTAQAGGNDVRIAMTECRTKTRTRSCIYERDVSAKTITRVHSFDDASW